MSITVSVEKKIRPPLHLPYGSVRALLTLTIVAVVITQLVRGEEVALLWSETLMIVLAHYFTSRRFIKLPPDVVKQLAETGRVEKEIHPLWLPRNSIRTILICAFVGVAVYLYQERQLFEPRSVSILGVVFAYFVGIFAKFKNNGVFNRSFEDLKAIIVLGVMAAVAVVYAMHYENVPHIDLLRNVALGSVLFYFGSR